MKFPVFFLHLWLPKAHVEAPTSASILLAGLLLKFGTVGFVRIIKSLSYCHINYWFFFSVLGMFISCFVCVFQSDFKSLAAYSSVVHMNNRRISSQRHMNNRRISSQRLEITLKNTNKT
uniref:NADH-ubiquinone oxidoreductase chain 4 n=1 Tax=Strongyloides stercoralis TaxID=6248 RepID=A0A0K0EK50_STRER